MKPERPYYCWIERPQYEWFTVLAENEQDAKTKTEKELGTNIIVHRVQDTDPNEHDGGIE